MRRWLGAVLLFVFIPFFIWGLAFLIWFNWPEITGFFGSDKPAPPIKSLNQIENSHRQIEGSPQEKILDEDRRKLDEILKQRDKN